MPTYLKHPEHGIHICYTVPDVEAHKKIGWVEFDIHAGKVESPIVEVPAKKRRGRPKRDQSGIDR